MESKEIFEGFYNLIFKDEKIERVAEERLKKCFTCSYRKDNKCGVCGCFIKAKARSGSKCPKNYW